MTDPIDVVLTKDALTALASDTRLRMLKDLNVRRMTVTELADDLDLAKSTVHHHLSILVASGFVTAEDEGHAWVYYALTPEGRALLDPGDGVRIRVLLAAALATLVWGIAALAKFLVVLLSDETPGLPVLGGGGAQVQEALPWNLLILGIALTLIGSVLAGYVHLRRKRRMRDRDIS